MAWRAAAAVNALAHFPKSTYHSLQFIFESRLRHHQDTFNLSDWLFRPPHPNQIIDLNQSFSRSRAPLTSSRFLGVVHSSSSDLMANGNSRSSAKVRVHRVRARCMLQFPPRENACACMPRYICVGNWALRNFSRVITPRPQRIGWPDLPPSALSTWDIQQFLPAGAGLRIGILSFFWQRVYRRI